VRLIGTAGGTVRCCDRDITRLEGKQLSELRRQLQIIFQDPVGSLNPRSRVGQIVRAGLDVHRLGDAGERAQKVTDMLARVGMAGLEDRFPHQLSGGQRQRVGIARALVLAPDFVVADEPVSALDVSVQSQILNLMVAMKHDLGLTLLFVSHNLAAVGYVSDRIAVMYLGKLVEVGAAVEILERPLHPYTAALVSAVPQARGGRRGPRLVLHGDVPSPSSPPSGCRFRTRCPIAREICAAEEPPLTASADNRLVACHFPGESQP
jgi:oligopeptide/dipeptide ABC transporter ATP-binding protein